MLSIGPRKIVQITTSSPTLNVGNDSYFLVQAGDNKPKLRMSEGKSFGHLILIECSLGKPFVMTDKITTYRMELNKSVTMRGADTIMLVWSGSRWVQVAYSKNS